MTRGLAPHNLAMATIRHAATHAESLWTRDERRRNDAEGRHEGGHVGVRGRFQLQWERLLQRGILVSIVFPTEGWVKRASKLG